jgi:heptose I phosphotransferase
MYPLLFALLLAAGLALARGVVRRGRRAFVEVAPGWRRFLREQGLSEPGQFLSLRALIVSGHPDRHVARVRLGSGDGAVMAYLKREHRVPWTSRMVNALAGFGLVSRSLREARTLQALSREDLGGPEWLAAGEDGRGRAFLLVREIEGSVDLRSLLRDETDPVRRLALAQALGTLLSRLHDAGFDHPDLYAKHVLVRPDAGTVHLLDWQRARRCRALGWRARGRSLAALHATLDPRLAADWERRACLRAYLAAAQLHPEEAVAPGRPLPPAAPRRVARLRLVLQGLRSCVRRLLTRRHVREKRQLPGPMQAWTCLDGEALCVTPALQERSPAGVPEWLPLDAQPPPIREVSRRWLELPTGGTALLTRRRQRSAGPTAADRRTPSPEQRQASLLLRLERHGVVAPRVLALGQRRDGHDVDSFLLIEPLPGTTSLEVWLRRRTDVRTRWHVLRQAGAFLSRLHEATCYLDGGPCGCGLAVSAQADGSPQVVLEDAKSVTTRRRRSGGREWRDLARMQRLLSAGGCSRTDLRRFWAGYRAAVSGGADRRRQGRVQAIPASFSELARPLLRAEVSFPSERETLWHRLLQGVLRLRQRPDWPRYAGDGWPDRVMGVAVTDRFHAKQGRTTGRWVLAAPGGAPGRGLTVYLKRHYRLPWWQGWMAALWPRAGWSPALQEWRHLQWARRQGVPVPEVVAAAEYIGPWGRLQSFLAVEELAGMMALNEAVALARTRLDPPTFRRWKRTLAEEMARLARMLHDRRVFHKDFYFCHFYVAKADTAALPAGGWEGRVFLIDLHRLAHHPWTWRLWQLKDLAQLLYSSELPGIDTRDRLWFWHAYRGSGPRRGTDRWLRRWVWIKWQSYRRHNARKGIPP